jgi:hypothetical protein
MRYIFDRPRNVKNTKKHLTFSDLRYACQCCDTTSPVEIDRICATNLAVSGGEDVNLSPPSYPSPP